MSLLKPLIVKSMLAFAPLALAIQSDAQTSTFQQNEFIIATMCEPTLDSAVQIYPFEMTPNDITRYSKIRDAHFNLLNSRYSLYQTTYTLILAEYVGGLKLMYTYVPGQTSYLNTQLGYSTVWQQIFYGIKIWDEPHIADFSSVQAKASETITAFPDKLAYINMEGGDGSGENPVNSVGRTYFENRLDTYWNPGGSYIVPKVASYDSYPFSVTTCGSNSSQRSRIAQEHYFYNLSTAKAKAGTRPLWVNPLSSEHSITDNYNTNNYTIRYGTYNTENCNVKISYKKIDYNKLMFMDFCPLAYGAKGLMYFTYGKLNLSYDTSWNHNIVDSTDDVMACTQRYQDVKNVNYYIKQIIGPIIMNTVWRGAFHKSNAPYNEYSLTTTGSLSGDLLTGSANAYIADVNNNNILFGVFEEYSVPLQDYCTRYILVVNKDTNPTPSTVVIKLKGNLSGSPMYLAPAVGTPPTINPSNPCGSFASAGSPYNGSTTYTSLSSTYSSATNTTSVTIPVLQGGEGRIFKIHTCEIIYQPPGGGTAPVQTSVSDVHSPKSPAKMSLYPNPGGTYTTLEYKLPEWVSEEKATIEIFDTYGKRITTINTITDMGVNKVDLNLSNYNPGIYRVMLFVDGENRGYQNLQVTK